MNPTSNITPIIEIKNFTMLNALYPTTDSPWPIESISNCSRENKAPKKSKNTNLMLKPTVDFLRILK